MKNDLHASVRCVKGSSMSDADAATDRILVVGPNWVGDVVMSQCLLKALRIRDTDVAIDILATASVAPLFERMPEVKRVIISPVAHREFRFFERMRLGRSLAQEYSSAYVLPGSWKSGLVPFAAGAPRRTGYLGEARWGLLNDIRRMPPSMRRRTAFAYQALAEPEIFNEPERLQRPSIIADADNRTRLLRQFSLSLVDFVVFVPGAEFGPAKRWPSRHWSALAARLDRIGLRIVLLGTKNDAPLGAEIAAGRSGVLDLTGRTRLEDAIDLISAARLAVTNDSGLMHVAAALGTKVAAVYGSTSPEDTPALSPRSRVISLGLPCSPCQKRVCPLGHFDCLQKLEAVEVMRALASLDPSLASRKA
jgi:heptosyltransferase II